ncbi:hypothetical protein NLI96_g1193 [Meripilus lineatus]|uniref:Uncharacterized protein n=1 Tax=Meripilus lineatus TaxID=2056292 RepID=A0AAD5YN26_9APHY|nr:hypothetical protein NLI96_g1193 [Physisporinus lineatus]
MHPQLSLSSQKVYEVLQSRLSGLGTLLFPILVSPFRLNWSKEDPSQGTSSDAFLLFQSQSPAICLLVHSLTITGSAFYAPSPDISLEDFALLVDNMRNLQGLYLSHVVVSIDSPSQITTNCHLDRLSIRGLSLRYSSGTQSDNDDEWAPIIHPLISFLRVFKGIGLLSLAAGHMKSNSFTGRSLEIIDQTLLTSAKVGIKRLELAMGFFCNNTQGTIALLECLDLTCLEYLRVVYAHSWIVKIINYIAEHSPNLTHVVLQIPSFRPLKSDTSYISGTLHTTFTIVSGLI